MLWPTCISGCCLQSVVKRDARCYIVWILSESSNNQFRKDRCVIGAPALCFELLSNYSISSSVRYTITSSELFIYMILSNTVTIQFILEKNILTALPLWQLRCGIVKQMYYKNKAARIQQINTLIHRFKYSAANNIVLPLPQCFSRNTNSTTTSTPPFQSL
jgi:hypothetical protein